MAVSLNSFLPFNAVSKSYFRSTIREINQISLISVPINSTLSIHLKRRQLHLSATESDQTITDQSDASKNAESVLSSDSGFPMGPTTPLEQETKKPSSQSEQSTPRRTSLTAKERLRAARVLSRYSESKPTRSERGRSVLDALKESDKGKKGLPEAPTNLFDDSKRGMPKPGLTFDFPGGVDLFLIAFSFVFISTVMFATTYIVWKVGAIHFNEY